MGSLLFRNPRIFGLAIAMIVAVGAITLTTIGRQEDPTITNLFATILTPYPGADPARVEALVTEKIEEELRELEAIDTIESTSRTGISVIQIELSDRLSDAEIEQAWSEVRDALADAAVLLPPGVPEPEFDNDRTNAFTAISAIVPAGRADVSLGVLGRYAELLQDRLRQVPGTEFVKTFGMPDEEILVEADSRRLAALGLTAEALSNAIAAADAKVEAGRVRGSSDDFVIEVTGEILGLDRVRNIVVRSGADGGLVRVGDVAEIRRTVREPEATKAFADGTRGVVVAARMEPGLQVDVWIGQIKRVLAEYETALPSEVEHRLLFDQSAYTNARLGKLVQNLAIGVALVIAVLFVTLGFRAALVVAVILPLTALISLTILQYLGVPIHQMSVTGLIVALGLLVDAAIVMTDEIRRRLRDGVDRATALEGSVRHLAMPLLASTATTVFAFMPMALLPGPAGDFVGSIAIAVIVMLSVSLLLAMTLTPALAGFLLPKAEGAPVWWRNGVDPKRIGRAFAASLDLALARPRLAILGALVLPIVGFLAFPTLTSQFFPGVDRNQFYVQLKLAEGASLAETENAVNVADGLLREAAGTQTVHWFLGESAPAFYYNMIADQDGVPSFAEALVTTQTARDAARLVSRMQAKMDASIPEAQIIVRGLTQGPPVAAPVELRIVGPDLQTLRSLGEDLREIMSTVPEVTHTRASLLGGGPKLEVDLDKDKLRLAGLTETEVARQLAALTEGATGGSLVEGSEELPVRVRLSGAARDDASAIRSLDIVPQGADVDAAAWPGIPLTALGETRLVPSDSPIERRNGERVNLVQAFIQAGVLPEEALKEVQARLEARSLDLPAGYRIEYGGDSDARSETVGNLMSSMGLIVALMVTAIVLTFNSYRLSLAAGVVAVLSMGLSLLALEIFAYPFGIQALIGVIGAIGVSINAAIIIMTNLQSDEWARTGDPVAIRNVVSASGRHIVSTTVTTFGGFLPLILEGGGFWPPFAMAIAGGVLLSTVVSFYFVPPMFRLLMGVRGGSALASGPRPASQSYALAAE